MKLKRKLFFKGKGYLIGAGIGAGVGGWATKTPKGALVGAAIGAGINFLRNDVKSSKINEKARLDEAKLINSANLQKIELEKSISSKYPPEVKILEDIESHMHSKFSPGGDGDEYVNLGFYKPSLVVDSKGDEILEYFLGFGTQSYNVLDYNVTKKVWVDPYTRKTYDRYKLKNYILNIYKDEIAEWNKHRFWDTDSEGTKSTDNVIKFMEESMKLIKQKL